MSNFFNSLFSGLPKQLSFGDIGVMRIPDHHVAGIHAGPVDLFRLPQDVCRRDVLQELRRLARDADGDHGLCHLAHHQQPHAFVGHGRCTVHRAFSRYRRQRIRGHGVNVLGHRHQHHRWRQVLPAILASLVITLLLLVLSSMRFRTSITVSAGAALFAENATPNVNSLLRRLRIPTSRARRFPPTAWR